MKRFLMSCALLAAVVGSSSALPLALASTVQGNAIDIGGLNDMNATVSKEAKGGTGKTFGLILGGVGIAAFGTGYHLAGALGAGAGGAIAFLPGIYSSVFDAAPAATSGMLSPHTIDAWWSPALALLYPLMIAVKHLQDPVFLASLVVVLFSAHLLRRAQVRPA